MEKILALWAHPRSTSTAFEAMMRQRGDFLTLHEPFGKAYYDSEDRVSHRHAHLPAKPEYNFKVTWQTLQQSQQQQPVFIKDMPTHIMHIADDEFLAKFTHTFIIRHPRKALPSLFNHWPDFTLTEAGYEDLHTLFNRLVTQGSPPIVIDSDDLLRQPANVVKSYCQAVGIPFIPEALTWEPGYKSDVSWYGGSWHKYTETSQEFKAKENHDYAPIESNTHLMVAYESCLPHYQMLYKHRLSQE